MSFINRNAPQNIDDLVFPTTRIKEIVKDYANGDRKDNLILHGPAGTGKSEAARAIVRSRIGDLQDSIVARPVNGHGLSEQDVKAFENDWSFQNVETGEAWTIIDEVDFAGEKTQRAIRDLIDSNKVGRIICTTNNPHKLDDAFLDRFHKVRVDRPTAADWIDRATDIMHREGHALNKADLETLLDGFEGSARDLMRELEHYHNKLNKP